jgi:hypothetical protein
VHFEIAILYKKNNNNNFKSNGKKIDCLALHFLKIAI